MSRKKARRNRNRKSTVAQASPQGKPTAAKAAPAENRPVVVGGARNSEPRLLGVWFALAVVLLGGYAFWGGLDNGFTNWDDNWLITENRHIRELSAPELAVIFNPFAPQEVREELGNEFLPLRDLSYSLNYAVDGYDPRGWHAVNLLLHLLNALLVLWLVTRLTGRRLAGGIAGLLFAVHPAHVEAVSWLSSRKDVLSCFFLFLALTLYLLARAPKTGLSPSVSFVQRVRQSRRLYWLLAVLAFGFALLSKMHAVVLPALLLLTELFFSKRLGAASRAKKILLALPFWVLAGAFALLAVKIGSGLMREPYGDSLSATLLSAAAALGRDLQVLLSGWPLQACVDFPLKTEVDGQAALGGATLLALLALGAAGLWTALRGRNGEGAGRLWIGFGALWFLAALAPVSNVFVQIGTLFAERYLYLPGLGVILMIAAVLDRLWVRGTAEGSLSAWAMRPLMVTALAGMAVVGVVQTDHQVRCWKDSETLWNSVLEADPENHTAHFNLGREYQQQGQLAGDPARRTDLLEAAYAEYERALVYEARTYRYDPARVRAAMAGVRLEQERPEEALDLLDLAAEDVDLPWRPERGRNDILAILSNLRGLTLSALGRHEEALKAFEDCLRFSSRYASARLNLAMELARVALDEQRGDIDEAALNRAWSEIADYERDRGKDALSLEARARIRYREFDARLTLSGRGADATIPGDLMPLLDESRALYRELIERKEQDQAPAASLAMTLMEAAEVFGRGRAGDPEAEKLMRRSLELDSSRVGSRYNLARLLFERGGDAAKREATRLIDDELRLHPDFQPARSLKASGILQVALNEAQILYERWREEFSLANEGEPSPNWTALIRAYLSRQEHFRRPLERVVGLLLQAMKLDPEADRLGEILRGFAPDVGRGLWLFGDSSARALAEELLRASFEAVDEDDEVAGVLTAIYLELAETAVKSGDENEFAKLIRNMLLLSETARTILANKLYNKALRIEEGEGVPPEEDPGESLRREEASKYMSTAALLDPDHIPALDWLKRYYQDEGDLEAAIKIYRRIEEALEGRTDLLRGVWIALGQTQFDLGQRMYKSYRHALKLGDEDRAGELAGKAVEALLDCVATMDRLLEASGEPPIQALRIKGAAAQRLAYFMPGNAYHYYTVAIEAFERLPLDFADELTEVRRKRSWFVSDPRERLRELENALREAPEGKDTSDIEDAILNLKRRITAEETEALVNEGRLDEALERINQGFGAPASSLYRQRGDIYMALSERAKKNRSEDEENRFLVLAAKDYSKAGADAEALVRAGELYQTELALSLDDPEGCYHSAREAFERATRRLESLLATSGESEERRTEYQSLLQRARRGVEQLDKLAADWLRRANLYYDDGKEDSALAAIDHSLRADGDNPGAWHLRGRIERDRSRAARAKNDLVAAMEWAERARESLRTAIHLESPLHGQVIAAQLDLAELLILDLPRNSEARFWLDAARRRLANVSHEELHTQLSARLEKLERLLP